MEDIPKVSVALITYGHEKFIRQSIRGVFIQDVDFKVELIISNDASPDDSDIIIRNIIGEAPDNIIVKYKKHETNLGLMGNFAWTISQSRGEFVAICEGDDFWTDKDKLKNQVLYLEKHEDCSMAFHAVRVDSESGHLPYSYPKPSKEKLMFKDLLMRHYVPTCSLIFKKDCLPKEWPSWFYNCIMADIPIELLLARNHFAKYDDTEMGVYRKHDGGITRDDTQKYRGRKGYIYMYKNLRSYLQGQHFWILSIVLLKYRLGYIKDWLGFNKSLR